MERKIYRKISSDFLTLLQAMFQTIQDFYGSCWSLIWGNVSIIIIILFNYYSWLFGLLCYVPLHKSPLRTTNLSQHAMFRVKTTVTLYQPFNNLKWPTLHFSLLKHCSVKQTGCKKKRKGQTGELSLLCDTNSLHHI